MLSYCESPKHINYLGVAKVHSRVNVHLNERPMLMIFAFADGNASMDIVSKTL